MRQGASPRERGGCPPTGQNAQTASARSPAAKEKIEQAAVVSHQSLTDFVVTSLVRVSEEALEQQRVIHLSNRDRDLFLKALEADGRPNRALRKATERFKRSHR